MQENKNKNRKKIVLIDCLNTYIRSMFNVPISRGDGTYIGGVYGTLNSIFHIINALDPYRVIVLWDGRYCNNKRRDVYKSYKSGRNIKGLFESIRKLRGMTDIEEVQKNYKMQLELIRRCLDQMGIGQILNVSYIEADDMAGIIYRYTENDDDTSLILYSADADWKQLISEKNYLYHPMKKRLIGKEELGIHPQNISLTKCILGDPSDNIDGIKGVGEKTLYKLIPQLLIWDKKVDIDEFVETCELNKEDKELSPHRKELLDKIIKEKEDLKKKYKVIEQPSNLINLDASSQVLRQYNAIVEEIDYQAYIRNLPNLRLFLMRNGVCGAKRFESLRRRLLQYYSK